jgi:hypothetical protein
MFWYPLGGDVQHEGAGVDTGIPKSPLNQPPALVPRSTANVEDVAVGDIGDEPVQLVTPVEGITVISIEGSYSPICHHGNRFSWISMAHEVRLLSSGAGVPYISENWRRNQVPP